MKISTAQLNDILRKKKGASAAVAIRFQACFGTSGGFLIRFQAQYDFQKACQIQGPAINREVRLLPPIYDLMATHALFLRLPLIRLPVAANFFPDASVTAA